MSQVRQLKKVKQYRTLKIVLYCLSLPLFLVAVFFAAVKFIGNDPFTGTTDFSSQLGFFYNIEILFTSPALFGVYLAFGVWMFITIVHAILAKVVKSRRTRALSVVALCLVVMLGGMFVMDGVLSAKISDISQNAPSGVTVADYQTQLSYYRTISSKKGQGLADALNEQTELIQKVYNVEMEGGNRSGVAGNISNKPVRYNNIIDDDGNVGVDISYVRDEKTGFPKLACDNSDGKNMMTGDGKKENDGAEVCLAPNANGELIINGKKYSHYFYIYRVTSTNEELFVWYAKDLMPTDWQWNVNSDPAKTGSAYHFIDGVYGKGVYNDNGMLADGYIFSVENVVEILEDYYLAKNAIENGDEYGTAQQYADIYAQMYMKATRAREDYYNGLIPDADGKMVDPWMTALYHQEAANEERFSLTRDELKDLLARVGELLGDNSLFDYLLINIDAILGGEDGGLGLDKIITGFLNQTLGSLFKQLNEGMSLTTLLGMFITDNLEGTMNTVIDYVKTIADRADEDIKDIYITAAYKATDAFGREQDHLYIALFTDDGNGGMGTNPEKDILIEIDLDYNLVDPITGSYTFDFDAVSEFLNVGLNNLLEKLNIDISSGIINTVLGLFLKDMDFNGVSYKGLNISGIGIPLINNTTGMIDLDINGILVNLLKGFYSYQSPTIKPVWEFYESEIEFDQIRYDMNGKAIDGYKWAAAKHFANLERAEYMATVHGAMIGSTLLGDTLGTGQYPASFGFTDLQSVQQYKTNMSYQPVFFPLYSFRDMLALFTGVVILFYFLSFLAAQKEEDYATGKSVALTRKEKKQLLLEESMRSDDVALDEKANLAEESGTIEEQPVSEQSAEEEINAVSDNTDESSLGESVAENEAENETAQTEETLVEDELNIAEENDFANAQNVEQSSEEAQTQNEYLSEVTAEFQEEAPLETEQLTLETEELTVENEESNEMSEHLEATEGDAEVANDIAETTEDTALPVEEEFDKEVR